MKKLIFNEDDFTYKFECQLAQEKHDEWLADLMASAVVVYGVRSMSDTFSWYERASKPDTHQGLLIDVHEIEKKCENHEPIGFDFDLYKGTTSKCKHCGIELKAEWRAK